MNKAKRATEDGRPHISTVFLAASLLATAFLPLAKPAHAANFTIDFEATGDRYGNSSADDGSLHDRPAIHNTLTIANGGRITGGVYGGVDKPNSGVEAQANNNTLTILSGGAISGGGAVGWGIDVSGGYAESDWGATYYTNATASNNTVVNESADVTVEGMCGGWATGSGYAQANYNEVINDGGSIYFIRGASARSRNSDATANNNTVTFRSGIVRDIYGGEAWIVNNGTAIANNNTISISGGKVNGGEIYGGCAISNNVGIATNNMVSISGGTVEGVALYAGFGGAVYSDVTNNTVSISGGAVNSSYIYGGLGYGGRITNNRVIISGGEVVNSNIYGAYGDAPTNNTVIISGGTVRGNVYGGWGWGDYGNATGNSVIISGGTVNSDIYGGYVSLSSGASGAATGNMVTIEGNEALDISQTKIYGGGGEYYIDADQSWHDKSIGDSGITSGNTFNLKRADVTVAGLYNFQYLNFSLPTNLAGGGTMLTVNGEAYVAGATVNVGLDGASSALRPGDTVTLIHAATLIGEPVTGNLQLNGLDLADSRLSGNATLAVAGNDLLLTDLTLSSAGNKSMTWTGGDPANPSWWDITSNNWTDNPNGAATETRFLDGDAVTFAPATATTIDIQGSQKTVAEMTVAGDGDLTINGNIIGSSEAAHTTLTDASGNLTKTGGGTLTLTGQNSFTGNTIVDGGALKIAGGGSLANYDGYIGRAFDSNGVVTVDGGAWTNNGSLIVGYLGQGTLNITGGGSVSSSGRGGIIGDESSSANGTVTVSGAGSQWMINGYLTVGNYGQGTLNIENNGLVRATGATEIGNHVGPGAVNLAGGTLDTPSAIVGYGGTLSGAGAVTGDVNVTYGGTLAGASGGTLTMGALTLDSGSMINVSLGAASTTELFKVNGNLTLDGTLNVTNAGGFGNGLYRLIDYSGTLTDNGLDIGATPTGYAVSDLTVQSDTTDKQINLIVGASSTSGAGPYFIWKNGDGVWSAANTNWSNVDSSATGVYDNTNILIFKGAGGGTVTVDGGGAALPISAGGLQFANNGFTVTGDALQLAPGVNTIRVGDSTTAGAAYNATIASAITGGGSLVKTDLGTLTLTGANTYSGGTTISGGVLSITADEHLGAASGAVTLDGGTLRMSGLTMPAITSRNFAITANNGTIQVDGSSGIYAIGGAITGAGGLTKTGTGYLFLSGSTTYSGDTTVEAGTLYGYIPTNTNLTVESGAKYALSGSSITVNAINGFGTIDTSYSSLIAQSGNFGGQITGTGGLTKTGAGTLTLAGANTYSGVTAINGGELRLTGSLGNGNVAVNNGGTLSGNGVIGNPVTVDNGGTLKGVSGDTLTMGALTLSSGSIINVSLGAPAADAAPTGPQLFTVNGTLTLDGTLDVTDAGLGKGLYRLISYGSLTDNGLDIGAMPDGYVFTVVTTADAGYVDLMVTTPGSGGPFIYWDGAYTTSTDNTWHGGNGDWNATNTNWANYEADENGVYDPAAQLIFTGAAGTVTVGTGGVTVGAGGLQFVSDGYLITGGPITVNNLTPFAVNSGAGATIASVITGAGGIDKIGGGTLALTGNNSYNGGTSLEAGRINAGHNNALGGGLLTMAGGTLGFTGNYTIANNIAVTGASFIDTAGNNDTLAGVISGTGALTKNGAGILALTKDSSNYAGSFTLAAGGLDLASTAKLGGSFTQNAGALTSANGATLGNATFSGGTVTPSGTLNLASGAFNGATVDLGLLTGHNEIVATGAINFAAPTTINVNATGVTSNTDFILMSGASLTGANNAQVSATNLGSYRAGQYSTATTLYYGVLTGPASLTWNGASSAWNTNATNKNWSAGFATYFMTGDSVVFDATATNKVVNVDPAGVSVGAMTVSASGYTFNLTAGSAPAITATGAIDLGNAALNITGYTPDTSITSYPPGGNVETVVTAAGGITNFNPLVTVTGQSTVDFLSASAYQSGNNINVETRLTWYSTDPNRKANGNFTIAAGQTFTLGAVLANNTTNLTPGWNGTTLTKLGAGTLVLSGTNTYTGGTMLNAGRINLGSGSALGSGALTMADGTTLGLAATGFTLANAINLSGVGTFDTGANSAALAGVISGDGGSLVKTGAGALVLTGANTYTGPTEVLAGILALSGAGTISDTLSLQNGTTFDVRTSTAALNLATLNVYGSANWAGNLNMANQTMNFYLPTTMASGQTALNVSGSATITGSTVNVGIAGENPLLQPGNTVTLIRAASLSGAPANSMSDNQWMIGQGATIDYIYHLSETANALVATISSAKVSEQSKSLSEGFVSGPGLVNQTSDLLADKGVAQAMEVTGGGKPGKQGRSTMAAGYNLGTFGAISGGWNRYNTGSNADISSVSLMAGLAWGDDLDPGRLTLGTFFEYGNGSYDTYNSFAGAPDARGSGNIYHLGGGILGRLDLSENATGNFYTEASVRAGSVHNDYKNGNLGGFAVGYETDSAYYGLHAGAGYILRLDEKMSVDFYGKYFWTRQNGDSVHLATGDPIRFDSVDSHRLRAGGRFNYALNNFVAAYAGLAYEHEFDGKARATAYDQSIPTPSLQGGTGVGEIGLTGKASKSIPLSIDLGVQGYAGTREGVTGSLQVRYEF